MRTGRPRSPSKGGRKSIYLSGDALDVIERQGYQTNLSNFIDALIRNTSDNSPVIIAVKIERIGKDIASAEEALNALRIERDLLQSQLNLHKYSASAKEAVKLSILRRWDAITAKGGALGEAHFRGWITGPANIGMVKDAGFGDVEEAIAWCKAQASAEKSI